MKKKKYQDTEAWEKYWDLRLKLDDNVFYRKKMDELFYEVNKHLKNK